MCGVCDASLAQVPADIALEFSVAIRDNHYPRPMTSNSPLMMELPKFIPTTIMTDEMVELVGFTLGSVFIIHSREHREAVAVLKDAFPEYMD